MSLFESAHIHELITDNGWEAIPERFVTREGRTALYEVNAGRLTLPVEGRRGVIYVNKIRCPILRWVCVKYVIDQATLVSSIEGLNAWNAIVSLLKYRDFNVKSESCTQPELLLSALVGQMEWAVKYHFENRHGWRLYRIVRFYVWASEHYPELGFDVAYAAQLDEMRIPGNPKGEAVRSELKDAGPLHVHLETPLIIQALANDLGQMYVHYQQRAAVALALCYGRNPANYVALNEEDLVAGVDVSDRTHWVLNIPRIKKRYMSHRSDFITEPVDEATLRHIQALISQNINLRHQVEVNGVLLDTQRPLFRRDTVNGVYLRVGMYDWAYRIYANEFSKLLAAFAERLDLHSPLTGEVMHLTARRFRYSVGTVYASMGMSRLELASRLDHSDLQNVDVYYSLISTMRVSLDKAAALHFGSKVDAFLGAPPQNESDVTEERVIFPYQDSGRVEVTGGCGSEERCYLNPPLSCYLCPKFRPFLSSVHERVLDALLEMQSRIRAPEGLGISLVDVILAVAKVVSLCASTRVRE